MFKTQILNISDKLYEFCKFALLNKDLIGRLIAQSTAQDSMNLNAMTKTMPNILNFKQKRNFFRKELEKLKREQR